MSKGDGLYRANELLYMSSAEARPSLSVRCCAANSDVPPDLVMLQSVSHVDTLFMRFLPSCIHSFNFGAANAALFVSQPGRSLALGSNRGIE